MIVYQIHSVVFTLGWMGGERPVPQYAQSPPAPALASAVGSGRCRHTLSYLPHTALSGVTRLPVPPLPVKPDSGRTAWHTWQADSALPSGTGLPAQTAGVLAGMIGGEPTLPCWKGGMRRYAYNEREGVSVLDS